VNTLQGLALSLLAALGPIAVPWYLGADGGWRAVFTIALFLVEILIGILLTSRELRLEEELFIENERERIARGTLPLAVLGRGQGRPKRAPHAPSSTARPARSAQRVRGGGRLISRWWSSSTERAVDARTRVLPICSVGRPALEPSARARKLRL
jgi:MFS family permease